MDNQETPATQATQDEDKQNKNTTQYAETNNVEVIVFIIILGTQQYNASFDELTTIQDN